MVSEYGFSPSDITVDNLNKLSLGQSEAEERRICEISELAYHAADYSVSLYDLGMSACEVLSLLSDSLSWAAFWSMRSSRKNRTYPRLPSKLG